MSGPAAVTARSAPPEFPTEPIPPAEFFEVLLPARFAAASLPDALGSARFSLCVALRGDGGGAWSFELADGALQVAPGARDDAPLTLVQSVADWRGGLWEGRGGAFGTRVSALFDPVVAVQALAGRERWLASGDPAERFAKLGAHIGVRVTGAPAGDWSAGLVLGAGSRDAADACVVLTEAYAADLLEGRLDVIDAVMGGKVQLEGDSGLLLKLPRLFGWGG